MRFSNRSLLGTSYALKRSAFRKILMMNLGLTSTNIDKLFNLKKNTLPCYRIIKNCLMCQKYNVNVDSQEKFQRCLRLRDYTLQHRINVFKDIGVPIISTSLLTRAIHYLNTKMSKFKDENNIPAEQDIATNIFGNKVPKDISQLQLNDTLTVKEYYQRCLLYHKTQIFNLSHLDDKIFLHKYITIKSINMIAETLKVLRIDLHYDNKMIKKSPLVINASADNIRLLLSSFTDIVGIPIVTVLREYPFMLFQDVENIKRLLMLFKHYKIDDKYVKNYMKVFMTSNEAFQERVEMLKRHPDLKVWYEHPRMLQIICQIQKTKDRMGYVNIMDSLKWIHPQSFLSSISEMDKSIQAGIVSSKHNLRHILMKELGVDESELLMRHQHWKTAAFVDIVQMLKYLKNHFTINEICPNIHIILYEQSRVEKVIADLKQQYSQNKEYSFTNSQYLALCLYTLEKDNNFTGDGVWSNDQNTKQRSSEEQNTAERSDNNTNTVKDNDDNLSIEDSYDIDHNEVDDKDVLSNNTRK